MSELRPAEAPPVKHADDELTVAPVHADPLDQTEIDHAYLALPRGARFYRSVLLQMIMFGACVPLSPGRRRSS